MLGGKGEEGEEGVVVVVEGMVGGGSEDGEREGRGVCCNVDMLGSRGYGFG